MAYILAETNEVDIRRPKEPAKAARERREIETEITHLEQTIEILGRRVTELSHDPKKQTEITQLEQTIEVLAKRVKELTKAANERKKIEIAQMERQMREAMIAHDPVYQQEQRRAKEELKKQQKEEEKDKEDETGFGFADVIFTTLAEMLGGSEKVRQRPQAQDLADIREIITDAMATALSSQVHEGYRASNEPEVNRAADVREIEEMIRAPDVAAETLREIRDLLRQARENPQVQIGFPVEMQIGVPVQFLPEIPQNNPRLISVARLVEEVPSRIPDPLEVIIPH